MTIEEFLKCSADDLEKMSTEELHKHFEWALNITRPELAQKPTISKPEKSDFKRQHNYQKQTKIDQANEILKRIGSNIRI